MITITVIIPHSDLFESAKKAFAECNTPDYIEYRITHAHGTRVMSMNLDSTDIVVARGLTLRAISRSRSDLTVIELPVSAYDVLRAIHDCRTVHTAKKISFIDPGSVIDDIGALQEMLGIQLEMFKIEDEKDITRALDAAVANGSDAVIGGFTACAMAEERGITNTMIRMSDETLRASVREAVSTAMVILNERAKAEISNAILQNAKDAILYFDAEGRLGLHNRRAFELLHFERLGSPTGRKAADLLGDAEVAAIIAGKTERFGVIKTLNNTMLVSDYIPVRVGGSVIGVICTFQRVNDIQAAESKIRRELNRKGLVARYGFDDIIHASPELGATIATARKYAQVDSNVLLIGETGTGKELFAQSIHHASRRRDGPFVAVNCASFSENLLESELFGYVEGAFTGAVKGGKAGLFELAHGGTLFLDEVGEIPMSLQATLLRALQEGEVRRIGDDKVVPVDVRIIAATNIDLRQQAAAGRFRKDLLYRLDVLALGIPPLRQRRDDIRHIARHYIRHYRTVFAKSGITLSRSAWRVLEEYDWPGNTRELKNVCERLVVLGEDKATISGETVAGTLSISSGEDRRGEEEASAAGESAELLLQLVNLLRMNRADLADTLGMSRTTLWRKMNRKERGGKSDK